jgi:hypothetical protein
VVVYALATLGATRLLFFSGHREVAAWEEPPLSSIITIDWGEVNKPVRYLKILAAAGLQGIINQAQQMPVVAQLCSEDDVERFSSEYRRFAYGECQLGGRAVQRLTIGQGMLRGVTLLLSCVDLMRKDDMTRSSRILTHPHLSQIGRSNPRPAIPAVKWHCSCCSTTPGPAANHGHRL